MKAFELSPEADEDVWSIWQYLVQEADTGVAGRVEAELFDAFEKLAHNPNIGHCRSDLTSRPVLFYKVFSYLIIYAPNTTPLQILGVTHGKRNVSRILRQRL